MKEAIRQRALELGFDDCRFTSAAPPASAPQLQRWLAEGQQGEMAWLARNAEKRTDPQRVLPGAKSVICLAVSYENPCSVRRGASRNQPPPTPSLTPHAPRPTPHGLIAKYARYPDYHDLLAEQLKQLTAFVNDLGNSKAPTPAPSPEGNKPANASIPAPLPGGAGGTAVEISAEAARRALPLLHRMEERAGERRNVFPNHTNPFCHAPRSPTLSPSDGEREETPPAPGLNSMAVGAGRGSATNQTLTTTAEHPPSTRSLWYVDTGPILERDLAQRAGLGFVGKHTNLISRKLGNWIFLAEILTTLELEPDAVGNNRCGSCSRCLTACPTRAITAPFQLDARLCISYLTIELKGSIPMELRPLIGNRIYGCDDCLAACPWNKFAREGSLMQPHARPDLATPDLVELLQLDDAGFKQKFAGTPMMRTKRRGVLRNVCVALGNVGDATALPALRKACGDAELLIAEHAQWAVEQIETRL